MISQRLIELIKDGEPNDQIWQEAIRLSDYIESNHWDVFEIAMRALENASHKDSIMAIATCLLEHLLEYDFSIFEKIHVKVREGDLKALYTLSLCYKFGNSNKEENSRRWDELIEENKDRLRQAERHYASVGSHD